MNAASGSEVALPVIAKVATLQPNCGNSANAQDRVCALGGQRLLWRSDWRGKGIGLCDHELQTPTANT